MQVIFFDNAGNNEEANVWSFRPISDVMSFNALNRITFIFSVATGSDALWTHLIGQLTDNIKSLVTNVSGSASNLRDVK